ncbi:hypothetical protein [Paludisphaera mucosa]|uniref:DUF998 domain-containing protein n=1 Tax=Paludisphaera mucosa TaxID=3030827 RepID=A0ABT6FH16_9BACT|nr:hypothetical protein [Paludisphaera mucosa]MDG3006867.1 hypothetical protein [Paludisphaera mucosa]
MDDPIGVSPAITPCTRRPFGLSDAMILVAAAAIGLALARTPAAFVAHMFSRMPSRPPVHRTFAYLYDGFAAAFPMVAALTLAAILLRFRRPRPTFRRLVRQPGLIACAAAATALVIGLLHSLPVGFNFMGTSGFDGWTYYASITESHACDYAVVGAWLATALSGRWRPERSWIDRLGRVLGAAWIGVIVLEFVVTWAFQSGW